MRRLASAAAKGWLCVECANVLRRDVRRSEDEFASEQYARELIVKTA